MKKKEKIKLLEERINFLEQVLEQALDKIGEPFSVEIKTCYNGTEGGATYIIGEEKEVFKSLDFGEVK